eukprot:943767-Amphidinium_carterae.2
MTAKDRQNAQADAELRSVLAAYELQQYDLKTQNESYRNEGCKTLGLLTNEESRVRNLTLRLQSVRISPSTENR